MTMKLQESWRLYISPPAKGAWNMAMDEAILEHVARGDAPPTLRLYRWQPPCLSLGRSQSFSDANLLRLQEKGWELVRRATGGRAILHADELTYALIAAKDNFHVRGTLLESYKHISQALVLALQDLGTEAEISRQEEKAKTGSVCFETPSMYEITFRGKKIIGSAQARQKGGVLQHGSLPLTGDLTRITQALNFPDAQSRQTAAKKLLEHATTLEWALGRNIAWEQASKSFVHAFERVLETELNPEDVSRSEKRRAAELVSEKYGNPHWTMRVMNPKR